MIGSHGPRTLFEELRDLTLEAVPLMVIAGLVYWFVRRFIHKKRFGAEFKEIRRKARLNEIIRLLLVIWATLIVCNTLLPSFNELPHLSSFFRFIPNWKVIPEIFTRGIRGIDKTHSLLNILMFAPIGLALPFVLKQPKFGWTVLAGFCFTFAIEFLQGFSSQRDGNTDDVICNTLGVIAGYALYLLIKLLFPKFTAKCMIKAETASEN
ncbi:MAG: VanZ family protein [Oscillospiraceae bacterium]|nr:VanZ family protein [Oscillospiraceae bacterium]